jgi:hypothetical protein
MINETMKDVRPQKPSNLSKELSCHHDACVHSEFSICPSGHHGKEAIHRSRRYTPKTSSSLEPSRHRSEKQLVGEYIYIYIYMGMSTPPSDSGFFLVQTSVAYLSFQRLKNNLG